MRPLALLALALLACSGADEFEAAEPICEPGKSAECSCPNGADDGVKECSRDGMRWGECECRPSGSSGATCAEDTECLTGLYCDGAACLEPVTVGGGSRCDDRTRLCDAGLTCSGQVCIYD